MKLICDSCGVLENVILLPGNLLQFQCGNVSEETPADLKALFRKYGGGR